MTKINVDDLIQFNLNSPGHHCFGVVTKVLDKSILVKYVSGRDMNEVKEIELCGLNYGFWVSKFDGNTEYMRSKLLAQ